MQGQRTVPMRAVRPSRPAPKSPSKRLSDVLFSILAVALITVGLVQSILMAQTWLETRQVVSLIKAKGVFETQEVCALAGIEGPTCPIYQFDRTTRPDGKESVFTLHFIGSKETGKYPCLSLRVPPEVLVEDSYQVYDFLGVGGKGTPCLSDFWVWLKRPPQ
jgi:hypothetical protein